MTGGGVRRFRTETREGERMWLREAGPEGLALFPMVPFFSRIKAGRFNYLGQQVQLPVNSDDPHPIHGLGWQQTWQVVSHTQSDHCARVTLGLECAAEQSGWPWRFASELMYEVRAKQLRIELSITNLSSSVMPCGLGLHPYFDASSDASVHAQVHRQFLLDATGMPKPQRFSSCGPIDEAVHAEVRDHVFCGWNGLVQIRWPNAKAGIALRSNTSTLVVYSPAEADFFCIEPVTNLPNGFNLLGEGLHCCQELAPGKAHTLRSRWDLTYN